MSEHSNVGDPDEYLKRLLSRILTYRLIENMSWVDASTQAARETRNEVVDDIKRDLIDGLIDMLFGDD